MRHSRRARSAASWADSASAKPHQQGAASHHLEGLRTDMAHQLSGGERHLAPAGIASGRTTLGLPDMDKAELDDGPRRAVVADAAIAGELLHGSALPRRDADDLEPAFMA